MEAGEETQGWLSIKPKHVVTGDYDTDLLRLCVPTRAAL